MAARERVVVEEDELALTSGILPGTEQLARHTFSVQRITSGVEPDRRRARLFCGAREPSGLIVHPPLVFGFQEPVGYSVPTADEVNNALDEFWALTSEYQR